MVNGERQHPERFTPTGSYTSDSVITSIKHSDNVDDRDKQLFLYRGLTVRYRNDDVSHCHEEQRKGDDLRHHGEMAK